MEENPENDQPEPINVTGELTIQDRMKLVSGISREIKHQVIALIKQYGSHFTALIGWVHSNSLRFLRFMLLKICTKCGFYGHNEPKCRLPDGATSRFNVCLLVDSKQDGGSGNG